MQSRLILSEQHNQAWQDVQRLVLAVGRPLGGRSKLQLPVKSFLSLLLTSDYMTALWLFFFFPQNAKLRTVSPVSVETFAQNVRKVCICTKGGVMSHAPKATLLPTAPWSAAVLVSDARAPLAELSVPLSGPVA